jgi:hypothetical protein
MHHARRMIVSLLVLMAGIIALPASAAVSPTGEGSLLPAVVLADTDNNAIKPVAFDPGHVTAAQLAAIVVGAAVLGTAADMLLEGGGITTVLGVVVGAVVGNEWYEKGYWPFQ